MDLNLLRQVLVQQEAEDSNLNKNALNLDFRITTTLLLIIFSMILSTDFSY